MFRNRTVGTKSPRKLERLVAILRFEGQIRATVGWHRIRFTWRPIQMDSEEQFGQTDLFSSAGPGWNGESPEKSCRLNRSMQHWLAVYSPEFQSPRSFAGVDSGAELPC